jgi:SAM-dependent methyltransferase
VHEAVNFPDGGRVYTHRWVWFDSVWRLAKLSAPFFLQERGIEFAGGLAQRGDDLVISYGLWDREAWLATVPVAEVLPLLAPPLVPDEVEAEMRETAAVIAPAVEIPAAAPQIESDPSATVLKSDDAPIPDEEPWADGITPFTAPTPAIVSTTLTGNSREVIGDALRSVVDWVDWVLVIDTGVTDDTLEIARQIAGDKLILRQFAWRDDFSAARNFALEAAAETGATWAVTLDTDERIDPGAIDIRTFLAETDADSLHVKQANGTYGKERFFRLPVRGQYVGPTHEAFIKVGGSATLEGIHFKELGKTHEHYRQKAERDVAILARHTAAHPDDPRWFYYLGDSLAGLDRHDEAIAAFRVCASLKGWDEEGAWAMYRAAQSLFQLGRTDEAIEACAVGMSRHAGLAELPWMAAYYSWQSGRPAQAAYWARQAAAMGHFAGAGATVPRIGFRHPPGLWEGPFDVLRFALRALGDESGAIEAQRLYDEARTARTQAPRVDVDVKSPRRPHQDERTRQTESKPYTPSYFSAHREETLASARAIVPIIMEIMRPTSVVDVGCGTGEWLATFEEFGVHDIAGVDGEWISPDLLQFSRHLFMTHDLKERLSMDRTFDLAMSLETAEHLPPECADTFVASLVQLAPAIIFSAAIPHQVGADHINLQWPAYWAALFGKHGYDAIDCIRPQIWNIPKIPYWYRQNTLLFAKSELIDANDHLRLLREKHGGQPLPLVHPNIYIWLSSQVQRQR